jgi:hypothetical protein
MRTHRPLVPSPRTLLRAVALPACVLALGATGAAPAQAAFGLAAPAITPTLENPESIALADFDGDGILDVAVGNRAAPFPVLGKQGGIALYRGTPGGLVPMAASPLAVEHNLPAAVRAADMNGDGHADLVSAASVGSGNSKAAVLLGDGAGGFTHAPGSPYPLNIDGPGQASGMAIADMNGDGHLDVVAGGGDEIAVAHGSATGVLGAPQVSALGFNNVNSLAVGDFVGDSLPDVMTTTNPGFSNLMRGTAGGLVFASVIENVGTAVLAADLDGAGRTDLIYSRINNDNIESHLSTGDGTFQAVPDIADAGLNFVNEMARADLDADGRPDLAVAAEGGMAAFAGGAGTALTPFPGSPFASGDFHKGVAIGDVTGDGQPDIVAGDYDNGNVEVFRNTNVAAATGPAAAAFGDAAVGGQAVDRTVTLTSAGTGFLRTAAASTTPGSPFAVVADGCASAPLIVGATCNITVRFTPVAGGPAAATLTVPDNTPGGSTSIALAGTGLAPAVPVPPTPPIGNPGDGTKPDTTRPVVSLAKLTPATFAVAKGSTATLAGVKKKKAPRRGTRITYRLSESARVTLTFERRTTGRRKAGRCVANSRALKRAKAKTCTRFVRVGALTRRSGKRGANTVAFSGRIGKKALKVGRYRVVITAVDAAGNRSRTPSRASFRVVKGR